MNKELAQKVLTVIDHKTAEVLEKYVTERKELLNRKLQQSNHYDELMRAQGSILELERLINLRRDAKNVIDMDYIEPGE